jgi:DNA repair protein RecO (recombination protein O)
MSILSTDALVLRAFKLGETSKLVVLMTRARGKLRAVARGARGARSRYHSSLESLSEVHVTLYGRQGAELYRLGGCELLHSAFRTGARDLDTALALGYFAELIDAFSPEGEAEDAAYRLALAVVRAAEAGPSAAVLSRYLEAWLLRLHGLYPPFDRCASCGGALPSGRLCYHQPACGFLCGRCGPAGGPVLTAQVRGFLETAFSQPPDAMPSQLPAEGDVLESFHKSLIRRHLERDLRSPRVLDEVAREVRG